MGDNWRQDENYILQFWLCVAVCAPAEAQSPSRIANVEARRTTSLNGKWRAIVDPYENGYYDFRLQPSKDGYFLDAKPKDKSDLVEYDFDTSGQLDVPGDWNTQRESLFFYEGTVWYRKTFDYPEASPVRACSSISAPPTTKPSST
jgi:beta-glucuronidase